jgi:uncharacterized membrane protein YebE (DUF533 family)
MLRRTCHFVVPLRMSTAVNGTDPSASLSHKTSSRLLGTRTTVGSPAAPAALHHTVRPDWMSRARSSGPSEQPPAAFPFVTSNTTTPSNTWARYDRPTPEPAGV